MKASLFRGLSLVLALALILCMVPVHDTSAAVTDGKFENAQLDIVSSKESTLAPGVTENQYTVYDKKGQQVKMFVATADMNVDSVKAFASYKNMDPNDLGIAKMTEHVAAFNQLAASGHPYYQGTVVAGINASYYNMTTGKPTGAFAMNGIDITSEAEGNAYGYFAIMKDGSMKIGKPGQYSSDKGNIQEAIGIYTMLIVDGEICKGLDASTKYPRQTIGITADNRLIIMSADGNQAPTSAGLTVQEQAQVMLDLGCVAAGHLDGGGSMSYASKPEGSDKFQITNSPSDGSERSVSNGFIIVSTAVASYEFDHVTYSLEQEYVTPGSAVKVTMTGVSATGNTALIPEDITYEVTNGSYENGVITVGALGETTLTAVYNGKAVGQTTVHVVSPQISFAQEEIVVPYDKAFTLPILATTNNGLNKVPLKDDDVILTLSDPAMGSINGMVFTACPEGSGIQGGTITMVSAYDASIIATAKVSYGKASEIVYNFEDLTTQDLTRENGWRLESHYINRYLETNGGKDGPFGRLERGDLEIVTPETGKVRNGNQALALNLDFTYSTNAGGLDIDFFFPGIQLEGATSIGMWVYFPVEEADVLRFRLHENALVNAGGDSAVYAGFGDIGKKMIYEDGWYYVKVDVNENWTAFSRLCMAVTDSDNTYYNPYNKFTLYVDDITVDYSSATEDREIPTFDNIYIGGGAEGSQNPMNGQTVNSNTISLVANAKETLTGNYTGLDVSSAKVYVDGVELHEGIACNENGVVTVSNLTLTNGAHSFRFEIQDHAGNVGMIERYVVINGQGGNVYLTAPEASLVPSGSVQWFNLVAQNIENVQSVTATIDLDNTNTFEMMGAVTAYGFTTSYSVDKATNTLRVKIERTGDVELTGEEVLLSIPVRVWSNKAYLDPEFIAGNRVSDNPGLVDSCYAMTPHGMWYSDGTRLVRVELQVKGGVVTFLDGTTDTFASEMKYITTEQNRYRAGGHFDANGKWIATSNNSHRQNKWSDHIHVAGTATDQAATCTENGYIGRIFCVGCDCQTEKNLGAPCDTHTGCGSVIDWGTVVPATGHSYAMENGLLQCACGKLFTGTYTDGKEYVDGKLVSDGWQGDSYYQAGQKLTGTQLIDGFYYNFGEDGVCAGQVKYTGLVYVEEKAGWCYAKLGELAGGWHQIGENWHYFKSYTKVAATGEYTKDGVTYQFDETGMTKGAWHETAEGVRYYYGPGYYQAPNPGYLKLYEIDGKTYYFNHDGYRMSGTLALRDSTAFYKWVYEFGEDGAMIRKITQQGPVHCDDAIYYINEKGVVPMDARLVQYGADFYYVFYSGKVACNQTRHVSEEQANGLVEPGMYTFGADGRMILAEEKPEEPEKPFTGIGADGKYYENGEVCGNKGLIKIGEDYYFVCYSGKIKLNGNQTVTMANSNGLMAPGVYYFGADGKMVQPEADQNFTGIKDGKYYEDGVVCGNKGVIELADGIYFVCYSGKIKVDGNQTVTEANGNGILEPGVYFFGADGKLTTKD